MGALLGLSPSGEGAIFCVGKGGGGFEFNCVKKTEIFAIRALLDGVTSAVGGEHNTVKGSVGLKRRALDYDASNWFEVLSLGRGGRDTERIGGVSARGRGGVLCHWEGDEKWG